MSIARSAKTGMARSVFGSRLRRRRSVRGARGVIAMSRAVGDALEAMEDGEVGSGEGAKSKLWSDS